MRPPPSFVEDLRNSLPASTQSHLDKAIAAIVDAKLFNRRVVVVTGSGPNIHEGVTTQIAELIGKRLVDGVITSSAVVAHEMAGTLDRVKRIRVSGNERLPIAQSALPRGGIFEITMLSESARREIETEMPAGWELYEAMTAAPGNIVIKAAGNMAWPMGLRTERIAKEIGDVASQHGTSFEYAAGLGSDPMTMMGAGARHGVPVLVSVPQLVGGGGVGLAIGDAISISRRSRLISEMLSGATVIIESAIALSQEIHDGPFETYTGHGIWAAWEGLTTYSLEGKTLIRVDLDPNLERTWRMERDDAKIQDAVNQGLPKTKRTGVPFRMEMSGFARLESSIPVTGDIGVIWPIIARALEEQLSTKLDFIAGPQESGYGGEVREWIAGNVGFLRRARMYEELRNRSKVSAAGPVVM
jgi:hypothetical protein